MRLRHATRLAAYLHLLLCLIADAHDNHTIGFGQIESNQVELTSQGHGGYAVNVQKSLTLSNWGDAASISIVTASNSGSVTLVVPEDIAFFRLAYCDLSAYAGAYTISGSVLFSGAVNLTTVTVSTVRDVAANGLPNHQTGTFPGPGNPHTISAQEYGYSFPTNPVKNGSVTYYNIPQPFGITREGVMIDPFAAEWYNNNPNSGWQLSAIANPLGFDTNNAHVQPSGAYHYHGVPTALITTTNCPELIGFAGDGFPIYGPYGYVNPTNTATNVVALLSAWRLKSGTRPSGPGGTYDGTYVEDYEYVFGSGDLDECNGRFGRTHEYPAGTYYYVITTNWPYIGRCFYASLAPSFDESGGGGTPISIALSEPPPFPPATVNPESMTIGIVAGSDPAWDGINATASFDTSSFVSGSNYAVVVVFNPGPTYNASYVHP